MSPSQPLVLNAIFKKSALCFDIAARLTILAHMFGSHQVFYVKNNVSFGCLIWCYKTSFQWNFVFDIIAIILCVLYKMTFEKTQNVLHKDHHEICMT